ncbi:MAG: hypothetical protein Q9220_004112 [cf. Caloplaca sp. 1 TL-2023]
MDNTSTLPPTTPPLISTTTVASLFAALFILICAIGLSSYLLPKPTSRTLLLLHTWHLFDFLIHTFFEGSFLYHSFFSYTTISPSLSSDYPHPASLPTSHFLSQPTRRYGAAHSTLPTALLWQEYARADARWSRTDTTIISIELLTVFIAGPLALYICFLLQQQNPRPSVTMTTTNENPQQKRAARKNPQQQQPWFLMTILATAELYGGFMTFAPELLTGNANLDTGNAMFLWLYLVFFNGLWVVLPIWVLWVAYGQLNVSGAEIVVAKEGKGVDKEGRKMR